ncbi:MAG: hypothetical protein WDZ35_14545, partial [Crocinitomicaceae bacterium]
PLSLPLSLPLSRPLSRPLSGAEVEAEGKIKKEGLKNNNKQCQLTKHKLANFRLITNKALLLIKKATEKSVAFNLLKYYFN